MISRILQKKWVKHIVIFIFIILIIIIILLLIEKYCRKKDKSFIEVLHPEWFKDVTQFPNHDFKCKHNCEIYNMKVNSGYITMKQNRLVIAGLCINLGSKVLTLQKRIEHLGSFFKDYRCIIFENDSTDNTRELLQEIQMKNNKIILMDCPDASECRFKSGKATDYGMFSPMRMEKMANYRNRLLNYIKKNFIDFDCIAFIDLDIKGPININGIANSFGFYNMWDSISAYGLMGCAFTLGLPFYYDLLAYRDGVYNFETNVTDSIPMFYKINNYKIGDYPYLVTSGFCSLAFYKMDIFRNDIYSRINYTPEDGNYKCEHVILHENMIKNGYDKIYANPNMTVLVGTQGNSDKMHIY